MKKLIILFVFIIAILISSNSYSFKESYIPTPELAKTSSDIVIGKCISSESKLDEKTGFVFTYITFKIDQTVKNSLPQDKIQFKIIGGQDGEIRTDVQGIPKFDLQEEMMLFIGSKNQNGYYRITSFLHGIYKLETDGQTGKKYVLNPPSDLNLTTTSNARQQDVNGAMLLDDFISNIKDNL